MQLGTSLIQELRGDRMRGKKATYKALSGDEVVQYVLWLSEALGIKRVNWRYKR